MSLGVFTADGAYKISSPDTPTVWGNKLFNDEYVLDVTQRLEGKSFIVKNYVQTGLADFSRRFYLNTNGDCRRLFCGKAGDYSAVYDTDKMTVTEQNGDFKITAEVTVPETGKRELWRFTIENKTAGDAKYNLFCFIPFVNNGPMGGECALSENRRYVSKFSFPYHVRYEDKERVEKNNGYTFIASDSEAASFDGDWQAFFGSDNREDIPAAVRRGACSNTRGQGDRLDGAMHFVLKIGKGESRAVTLVIGSAETAEEIAEISDNFPDFDEVYRTAHEYRQKHFAGFQITTPDTELNFLFNKWLKKQMVYLARLNRGGV